MSAVLETPQDLRDTSVDLHGDYVLTIGGELVSREETFEVTNPATGELLARAPQGSAADLDRAVDAARAAQPGWAALSWDERGEHLTRFADALAAQQEDLARLLTLEQGKPLRTMASKEVEGAILWVREVAKRRLPVEQPEDTDEHVVQVHHTPLGVVGAITPWNFPVLLAMWKLAPALVTGNTIVIKPSPFTPLCTLKMGEIAQRSFPAGVVNVVSGGNELGQHLTEHPHVAKVSFTGSTATGKRVMASSAGTLKRVTLELGGNDAAIVLPGADWRPMVERLFWAAFGNSGQWCIAIKRLYVPASIHADFVDAFVAFARDKVLGSGLEPGTDLGPIQNAMQYDKLLGMFADIAANGYDVRLGGTIDEARPGNFVPVTIVSDPPDDSRIVREEPFGPVLPILSYGDVDEAVARANDTDFGLAGSVWGPPAEATAVAARLQAGTVWVNEIHIHGVDLPFGGYKQSGMGVENGHEGLIEFTNTQTLMVAKDPTATPPVEAADVSVAGHPAGRA